LASCQLLSIKSTYGYLYIIPTVRLSALLPHERAWLTKSRLESGQKHTALGWFTARTAPRRLLPNDKVRYTPALASLHARTSPSTATIPYTLFNVLTTFDLFSSWKSFFKILLGKHLYMKQRMHFPLKMLI